MVNRSKGDDDGKKYRDRKTGRYVTESTAKRHPDTTVGEDGGKEKRTNKETVSEHNDQREAASKVEPPRKPSPPVTDLAASLWFFSWVGILAWGIYYLGLLNNFHWPLVGFVSYLRFGFAILLCLLGLVSFIAGCYGLVSTLRQPSGVRNFLIRVLPWPEIKKTITPWGHPDDDWAGLAVTAITFVIAFLGIFAIVALEMGPAVGSIVKSFVIFFLLFGFMFLWSTIDDYFIRPFIEHLSKGENEQKESAKRARKIIVAVATSVVALLGLISTILGLVDHF